MLFFALPLAAALLFEPPRTLLQRRAPAVRTVANVKMEVATESTDTRGAIADTLGALQVLRPRGRRASEPVEEEPEKAQGRLIVVSNRLPFSVKPGAAKTAPRAFFPGNLAHAQSLLRARALVWQATRATSS